MALRISDTGPNFTVQNDLGEISFHDLADVGGAQLRGGVGGAGWVQATYDEPIATPANWNAGEDVIVALSMSDEEENMRFGEIDSKLLYLRTTKDPS